MMSVSSGKTGKPRQQNQTNQKKPHNENNKHFFILLASDFLHFGASCWNVSAITGIDANCCIFLSLTPPPSLQRTYEYRNQS